MKNSKFNILIKNNKVIKSYNKYKMKNKIGKLFFNEKNQVMILNLNKFKNFNKKLNIKNSNNEILRQIQNLYTYTEKINKDK